MLVKDCSENRRTLQAIVNGHADALPWFLIQTKPAQEYRAQCFLSEWSLSLLPVAETLRARGANPTPERKPLFTGYVMASFPETSVHRANLTVGVLRVVSFAGIAARVPQEVVREIVSRLDEHGCLTTSLSGRSEPQFKHGDRVRITSGQLAGWEGIFDSQLPGKDRAQILLNTIAHYAGGWTVSSARQAPAELHGAAFKATVNISSLTLS